MEETSKYINIISFTEKGEAKHISFPVTAKGSSGLRM